MTCPDCDGRGVIFRAPYDGADPGDAVERDCSFCKGTGDVERESKVSHQSRMTDNPATPGMTYREVELLEVIHHLLRLQAGETVDYHRDWVMYHAGRAVAGMPPEIVAKLEKALRLLSGSES